MVEIKTQEGIGKKIGIGVLKSGLVSLYHEIRRDESSLRNELVRGINNHLVKDPDLNIKGSISDIAAQYGLESELNNYIQKDVVGGIRGRLRFALDMITSAKDSLEDVVEGAELMVTFTPVEVAENIIQVPLYLITQTVYSVLAGMLGYTSGTYALKKEGAKNYLIDITKGYLGAMGDTVPVLGGVLELGTNLDDKRGRIIESSSRRTKIWLFNKIREAKGLPLLERDRDLVDIVDSLISKIRKKKEDIKIRLADYTTRLRERPVYAADVTPKLAYATI